MGQSLFSNPFLLSQYLICRINPSFLEPPILLILPKNDAKLSQPKIFPKSSSLILYIYISGRDQRPISLNDDHEARKSINNPYNRLFAIIISDQRAAINRSRLKSSTHTLAIVHAPGEINIPWLIERFEESGSSEEAGWQFITTDTRVYRGQQLVRTYASLKLGHREGRKGVEGRARPFRAVPVTNSGPPCAHDSRISFYLN